MTVLIANNTPDAIRGMLKRWFIEPKPNVFVGTVNKKTRDKTIEYVLRNAKDLGLLIIATEKNSQGFIVKNFGQTDRIPVKKSGHFLVAEKWQENQNDKEMPENPLLKNSYVWYTPK